MLRVVAVAISSALPTACGPVTGCADVGGDAGVQITAADYLSDATTGHTVAVCVEDVCGTASLDEPFPFVVLADLREQADTPIVVGVRSQQEQLVRRTTLDATPIADKPGVPGCDVSAARLRLSLAAAGTARVTSGSGP